MAAEKELMQIFERTYGPVKPRAGAETGLFDTQLSPQNSKKKKNSDPWGLENTGGASGKGAGSSRAGVSGKEPGSSQSGMAGKGAGISQAGVSGKETGSSQTGVAGKGAGSSQAGVPGKGAGTDGKWNKKTPAQQDHYLLVDGYNIIFAWDYLRELAMVDIKSARDKLMDILSNFAGYRSEKVILVFDAYKVAGGPGEVLRWHNIDVVFTKEAETADLYIEKTAHVLAKKYRVTVATSDAVEQIIIFGAGAYRMSAGMLLEEIIYTEREMRERYDIASDED